MKQGKNINFSLSYNESYPAPFQDYRPSFLLLLLLLLLAALVIRGHDLLLVYNENSNHLCWYWLCLEECPPSAASRDESPSEPRQREWSWTALRRSAVFLPLGLPNFNCSIIITITITIVVVVSFLCLCFFTVVWDYSPIVTFCARICAGPCISQ